MQGAAHPPDAPPAIFKAAEAAGGGQGSGVTVRWPKRPTQGLGRSVPPAQVDGPNRNLASAAFIPWGGGPLLSWKLAACPPGKFLTHNRCPAPVLRQDVSMCSRAVEEVSKPLQNKVNCIRFLLSPDGPHAVYFEQGEDVAPQGSGTSGLTASENAQPHSPENVSFTQPAIHSFIHSNGHQVARWTFVRLAASPVSTWV